MNILTGAIAGTLTKVAAKAGAPLVKGVLEKYLGKNLAVSLAGEMVAHVAAKAGVEPEKLAAVEDKVLETAIREREEELPELVTMWSRGLEMQQALAEREEHQGFVHSFWRVGWMYLLAVFWIWRIVIVPIIDGFGVQIEAVDMGVLLTLTSWFMALYMGGHTVKELGKNVAGVLIKERNK